MRDPFAQLIRQIKDLGSAYNQPSIMLAEVISPSPTLIVKMGDIELDIDNLLVSDHLLSGYQREISISESPATGSTNSEEVSIHGSHSHTLASVGVPSAVMQYIDDLTPGDTLAVMPTIDMQTFIILARVVSLL